MTVKNPGKGISKNYSSRSGSSHWNWKGEKTGYMAIHEWIYRMFGKADHCEKCGCNKIPEGKKRWFNWSSKTKKYTKNRESWWQLCIPCHREFDKWKEKISIKHKASRCWEKRQRGLTGKYI